jgi:hypothetical protein
MDYNKRTSQLDETLKNIDKKSKHQFKLPRWAGAALISAGLALGSGACEPPSSDDDVNNQNNVNNVNNANNINNLNNENNINNSTTNNVLMYGAFEDAGTDAESDSEPDSDINIDYGAP